MPKNPYPRLPGYSKRVAYAKARLEEFGRDASKRPYSRAFDKTAEMGGETWLAWLSKYDHAPKPQPELGL